MQHASKMTICLEVIRVHQDKKHVTLNKALLIVFFGQMYKLIYQKIVFIRILGCRR